MHRNFQAASFQMALKRCAPQLSNCFPLNDSRDLYTATFKLLSSKWLLREMHRNFQTASFSMILEKYAPQLLNCFLLNDSRYIYIYIYIYIYCNFRTASFSMTLKKYALQLSHCFLLGDSWDMYTATFKLLPSKWFLRYIHWKFQTASF